MYRSHILVCGGTGCTSSGSAKVIEALERELAAQGLSEEIKVIPRKKLSPKLKIPIAFTKLLGDLFAGVAYAPESIFVAILAVLVFYCNIAYLCLCIGEIGESRDQAGVDSEALLQGENAGRKHSNA